MSELYIGDAASMLLQRKCDAVRTIEDVKARCFVSDENGCWHWRLGKTRSGAADIRVFVRGKHEHMNGRRAAFILNRGKLPPRGHRVFAVPWCASKDCVNPDHLRTGTAAQYGAAIAKTGILKHIPSKVRANRETARRNAKLTMEQARQIRASAESASAAAKRFGVSVKTVWSIRNNERYKETGNVMPTADVFAWAQNIKEAA